MNPSWADVGIPQTLVHLIKGLSPGHLLDALIHQFVFRNCRKPHFTYHCNNCDYLKTTSKLNEEIVYCEDCNHQMEHRETSMKFTREILPYSRKQTDIGNIVEKMKMNFMYYFRTPFLNFINCGWNIDSYGVYCEFANGEKVCDLS